MPKPSPYVWDNQDDEVWNCVRISSLKEESSDES